MGLMKPEFRDPSPIIAGALFTGAVIVLFSWASSWAVGKFVLLGSEGSATTFVNYSVMIAVSLIFVLVTSKGGPAKFGFRRSRVGGYGKGVVCGLLLGAAGSVTVLTCGHGGISAVGSMSFWEMLLLIWVLASVAEETLVRGYVQSCLEPLSEMGLHVGRIRVSLPVLLSALFFSAMHLILFTSDTHHVTIGVVMIFTFLLGLITAYQRERTGSIVPSIATHMSFNVGGAIGGILFVIAHVVILGRTTAEVIGTVSG